MFRDQTHIDADTFIHPCLIYAATRGGGGGGEPGLLPGFGNGSVRTVNNSERPKKPRDGSGLS